MSIATTDTAAVRALFETNSRAWGDTEAFARTFTEDADYVTFFGGRMTGRNGIADGHRGLFEGVLKGSRLYAEIDTLTFLGPDTALIHSRGAVRKGKRTRPSARAMSVQTYVMTRGADGH
jgi:uncharacterized protein (TIGR02246 family)